MEIKHASNYRCGLSALEVACVFADRESLWFKHFSSLCWDCWLAQSWLVTFHRSERFHKVNNGHLNIRTINLSSFTINSSLFLLHVSAFNQILDEATSANARAFPFARSLEVSNWQMRSSEGRTTRNRLREWRKLMNCLISLIVRVMNETTFMSKTFCSWISFKSPRWPASSSRLQIVCT